MQKRRLGTSEIEVTSVAMGCWPIAGVTSLDVNDEDSLDTLRTAFDSGVTFFDTAYSYGINGESELLIAKALSPVRDRITLATKCGIHRDQNGQTIDNSPSRLREQLDTSLKRLKTDFIDLLYLHAPDPNCDLFETAAVMRSFLEQGKARTIGVSNFSVSQLESFHAICPITATQPAFNMLQRDIERDVVPWCLQHSVSVVVYWPLMKGLLAGKLPRDHQFGTKDGRAKYPMFQGEEWQKNQDFVDQLRSFADSINRTVAQVVINWTIQRPGITVALCGAKRAYQIEETAISMEFELTTEELATIDSLLEDRGDPITRPAV